MTDIFVAPKETKEEKQTKKKVLPPLHHRKYHMGIISSFSEYPKDISFQNQKSGEEIILFLRSHPVINLSWIITAIILTLLPPIAFSFMSLFNLNFLQLPRAGSFTFIFVLLYYSLIFSYVFISFMHWFYNVFIVTTERVVDIDYSDIVVHNIAATNLSYIQDVNYTQSGFIPTFFNYGNLFVQTAGTEMNFEAYSIPKPTKAINVILELLGKTRKR